MALAASPFSPPIAVAPYGLRGTPLMLSLAPYGHGSSIAINGTNTMLGRMNQDFAVPIHLENFIVDFDVLAPIGSQRCKLASYQFSSRYFVCCDSNA